MIEIMLRLLAVYRGCVVAKTISVALLLFQGLGLAVPECKQWCN